MDAGAGATLLVLVLGSAGCGRLRQASPQQLGMPTASMPATLRDPCPCLHPGINPCPPSDTSRLLHSVPQGLIFVMTRMQIQMEHYPRW